MCSDFNEQMLKLLIDIESFLFIAPRPALRWEETEVCPGETEVPRGNLGLPKGKLRSAQGETKVCPAGTKTILVIARLQEPVAF